MSHGSTIIVRDGAAFLDAVRAGAPHIAVAGVIDVAEPVALAPGQTLSGVDAPATIRFAGDGLGLSASNDVRDLRLVSPPSCAVIAIAPGPADRNRLVLERLVCVGHVRLILGDDTDAVAIELRQCHVEAADASTAPDRPFGNGVHVLQGGLTIWNRASRATTVRLIMEDVSIGSVESPAFGSGLFVAGAGDDTGGVVVADDIVLGAIHCDSGLAAGVTGIVAGGAFFLQGSVVGSVLTRGSITTRGANAVPVDNWGHMGRWIVEGDAVSHGPSAIGFINAGTLDLLEIRGKIETFGEGARGCSIYGPTGTVRVGGIHTRGDAATAVQVCDRLDRLEVSGDIVVDGNPGRSLVKGIMHDMPADGIHVERGAILTTIDAPDIRLADPSAQRVRRD